MPDKKSKYCPSCGSPIIQQKKSSPIIDAIILGSIIVLFIFAVIKISQLVTDYRLGKITETRTLPKEKKDNSLNKAIAPEVRAPQAPGHSALRKISNPKVDLIKKIRNVLKGVSHEISINYEKNLKGYEVDVTIYRSKNFTLNEYLNIFANILAICYGNDKINVKFVICKVQDNEKIRLSVALGADAAAKIPPYTWDLFGSNGMALVRWIEKHQTPSQVGKISMCRFFNNL